MKQFFDNNYHSKKHLLKDKKPIFFTLLLTFYLIFIFFLLFRGDDAQTNFKEILIVEQFSNAKTVEDYEKNIAFLHQLQRPFLALKNPLILLTLEKSGVNLVVLRMETSPLNCQYILNNYFSQDRANYHKKANFIQVEGLRITDDDNLTKEHTKILCSGIYSNKINLHFEFNLKK